MTLGPADKYRPSITNMFAALLLSALVGSAVSTCPQGWAGFGADCYWMSTYTAVWRDAQTSCLSKATGSNLVTINSLDEHNFIFKYLGARDTWIGLNDLNEESHFVWADGSPVTYTNWLAGQPNNLLDQDCVNFTPDSPTGQWDDNHCAEHKTFVCKITGGI